MIGKVNVSGVSTGKIDELNGEVIVGNANDKIDYTLGTKDAIKTAIENKGVTVSSSDTFRSYASKIDDITSGIIGDYTNFVIGSDAYMGIYNKIDGVTIRPDIVLRIGSSSLYSTLNLTWWKKVVENLQQFLGSSLSNMSVVTTLELGNLDCSSVNIVGNTAFSGVTNLTTINGCLKDLGANYNTTWSANYSSATLRLSTCPNLTHDSLMNMINGLYNIASKGVAAQQLILGSTNLGKLSSSEIAVATNKGWTVS